MGLGRRQIETIFEFIFGWKETGIAPDHFTFNETQSVLPKL